ncbi:MAG TPA: BrnT family toxin [Allosphingosinicella sp.]|nr:BrnT family toxin [Allosphingosinicella sp.]
MKIEFDPAKREWTLRRRGLDFAQADRIFGEPALTVEDERQEYGEERFLTLGVLNGEVVACVWTQRGEVRRIISLRKARRDERETYSRNRRSA